MGRGNVKRNELYEGASASPKNDQKSRTISEMQDEGIDELPERKYKKNIYMNFFWDNEKQWEELKELKITSSQK